MWRPNPPENRGAEEEMSKFKPGQSGNPGGRPKGFAEVRELAREHTVAAIDKLVAIMTTGQSEQAQLLAANSLLDRGWGKPTQPIAGDSEGPPIIHGVPNRNPC